MENVNAGDVVISLSGRDKGGYFLVISAENDFVFLVDGKVRKVNNPKKKKVKHVKIFKKAVLTELAEEINGSPVSDKRVRRFLSSVKEY